jgi:hypothetical protein
MCNCSFPMFVSLFDTAKCVDLACQFSRYYIDFNEAYIQTKCLPECPLECNATKFNVQLTGDTLDVETAHQSIVE